MLFMFFLPPACDLHGDHIVVWRVAAKIVDALPASAIYGVVMAWVLKFIFNKIKTESSHKPER
jgi:hypothetical protein